MALSVRERAELLHRQGLQGVRAALRLALVGHDHDAPVMARTQDLAIPGAGGALAARLYRPDGAVSPGPALLFFHGGGFVVCDIETHDALCRRLAEAAGVVVISVDYRLAPEAPFPAQVEDGEAAARWLLREATALGVDPARLAVGGDSAGGYIAADVSRRLNAERPGTIALQLLIYPLLQLDDDVWSSSFVAETRLLGRLAVRYINAQLHAVGTAPSLLSPDPDLTPPTLLISGGPLDPCRPDARTYAQALIAKAGLMTVREYPALPHGFANLTHASAAARSAVSQIGTLLGERLRGQTIAAMPRAG